jgi:hypothetical protein
MERPSLSLWRGLQLLMVLSCWGWCWGRSLGESSVGNKRAGSELCAKYSLRSALPRWNQSTTDSKLSDSLYVGATYPENMLASHVPADEPVYIVLFRRQHRDLGAVCQSDIESTASHLLGAIRSSGDPKVPTKAQKSLYGRVSVEGSVYKSQYRRIIRSPAIFLEEVNAASIDATISEHTTFYWFKWIPPLAGDYNLTVTVDFVDCRSPLSSISNPSHCNGEDTLRGLCHIVYSPVLRIPATAVNTKGKLSIQEILSVRCDLTDMSTGFWIYPPILRTVNDSAVEALMGQLTPDWVTNKCPSFHRRLATAKDTTKPVVMIGDSNTRRTCTLMNRKCNMDLVSYLDDSKSKSNVIAFYSLFQKCVSGAEFCAVNIGHHMVGHDSSQLVELLTRSFSWLKLSGRSHPEYQVAVWSSLASLSSMLNPVKFKETLHFLSNAYRELYQNLAVKDLLATSCSSSAISRRKCSYIDMFSPSSALLVNCHDLNDPVHFRHGNCGDAMYKLVADSFIVTESCSDSMNCDQIDAEVMSAKTTRKYMESVDPDIGYLPKPTCAYGSQGKCYSLTAPIEL